MTKAKLDTAITAPDFSKFANRYGYRPEMVKTNIKNFQAAQKERGEKVADTLTFRDVNAAIRRLHYAETGKSTVAVRPTKKVKKVA